MRQPWRPLGSTLLYYLWPALPWDVPGHTSHAFEKSRLAVSRLQSVPELQVSGTERTGRRTGWDLCTLILKHLFICPDISSVILSSWTNGCVGSVIINELSWNSTTLYPHSYSLGKFWRAVKPSDFFLLLYKRIFLKFTRLTNQSGNLTFGLGMYHVPGRFLALGPLFYFVISFRDS